MTVRGMALARRSLERGSKLSSTGTVLDQRSELGNPMESSYKRGLEPLALLVQKCVKVTSFRVDAWMSGYP